jgi:hypothetical protein
VDILEMSTLAQRRGAVDQAEVQPQDNPLVPVTHHPFPRRKAATAAARVAVGQIMVLAAAVVLAQ